MRGAPKRFPARLRLPGAAGFPKTTATGFRIWGHGMGKMVIPGKVERQGVAMLRERGGRAPRVRPQVCNRADAWVVDDWR